MTTDITTPADDAGSQKDLVRPLSELVDSVRRYVEQQHAVPGLQSRRTSLADMWRFYGLGEGLQWVQVTGLNSTGGRWVWTDEKGEPHYPTTVRYVKTWEDAEEALFSGGDGRDGSPLRVDKWLSTSQHVDPSGYYFTPAKFPEKAICEDLGRLTWEKASRGQLIQDSAVVSITGISIDVDRKREGDNATDQEHLEAMGVALSIGNALHEHFGVPLAALAQGSSGNGGRCDLAVDLPNDKDFAPWVTRFVNALARIFDVWDGDKQVIDIDVKCSNPARLLPLYGSVKAKGEATKERPHRRTYFVFKPPTVTRLTKQEFHDLVERVELVSKNYPDRMTPKIVGEIGKPPKNLDAIPMADRVERAKRYLENAPIAVSGSNGHATAFAVVLRVVRGYALTDEDEAMQVLEHWNQRCEPPWSESELRHKVKDAQKSDKPLGFRLGSKKRKKHGDWKAGLLKTTVGRGEDKREVVRNVRENIVHCLTNHPKLEGLVAFDEFCQDIVFQKAPPWTDMHEGAGGDSPIGSTWKDVDDLRVATFLSKEAGMVDIDTKKIVESLRLVAWDNTVHPLRDYLDSLKWDGKPRVKDWLVRYAGANASYGFEQAPEKGAEYVSLVGKWWLLQAVARVYQPGAKCDSTLVLEGPQGAQKSTLLGVLAGEKYFSDGDLGDLKNKESAMQLQGVWIQELGEGEIFNRASRRALKAFITKLRDDYIPKHSNRKAKVPRRTVFCVTTNDRQYLDDPSGERRWWPVWVVAIDLPALKRDRDQLWAEAVYLYGQGAKWWADTAAEKALCETATAERKLAHPWEEPIRNGLRHVEGPITINYVLTEILGFKLDKLRNTFEESKAREILVSQGWELGARSKHGQRWQRGATAEPYEAPPKSETDEMSGEQLDAYLDAAEKEQAAMVEELAEAKRLNATYQRTIALQNGFIHRTTARMNALESELGLDAPEDDSLPN